jgi:adenosylcobinamide-GDP ribazoletransferase
VNVLATALRGECRLFMTAVQYFTRVPVPASIGHSAAQLDGSARYFPLVGIGVGAIGALVLSIAGLVLPQLAGVIASTITTMLLTGAFHEDGLADSFDGLGATADRTRALEIMKDSRVGTFGALALMMTVLLKLASLSSLPLGMAALALIAGHAVSRWCSVLMIWRMTYVRDEDSSRAKPVIRRLGGTELLTASVFGLAPLMLGGRYAACGLLMALLALLVLSRWFLRRLGGYTGDTLGATQQVTEVMFYLGFLGAWTSF